MKKMVLISLLLLTMMGTVTSRAEVEYTANDTIWILVETHLNYTFADWTKVLVLLSRNNALVGDTVVLTAPKQGRYIGAIALDTMSLNPGVYLLERLAIYGSDTSGTNTEIEYRDTTDLQINAKIGGATDPKDMATTLFAGQQSIYEDVGGGGAACGGGAFACTISVRDTVLTAGIPQVHVFMMNDDQTASVEDGYTDANGIVIFLLDSMQTGQSYKPWLIRFDYDFAIPETADLRTDTTFTFYGDAQVVQCLVWGQIFHPTLDSLEGVEVTARLYVPGDSVVTWKGNPISPFTVFDTTDADGKFAFSLVPNDSLRPAETGYIFNIFYDDRWGGYFYKPDQDTLEVPGDSVSIFYGNLRGR